MREGGYEVSEYLEDVQHDRHLRDYAIANVLADPAFARTIRIFVAGRRGAGKSTVCRILREEYDAIVVNLTEPIYDMAVWYFGMADKDRALLQRIGDAFRAIDPDWLAQWAYGSLAKRWGEREREIAVWRKIRGLGEPLPQGPDLLVIESVRLVREAEWLVRRGFHPIQVVADDAIRALRVQGESARDGDLDAHVTEREVDEIATNYVIVNNGSLQALRESVARVIARLREEAAMRGL